MAKIDQETLEYIAELAKLELDPTSLPRFQKELGDILSYFETLQKLDTSSVPITAQVTGFTNHMREDNPKENLSQEEALSNAGNIDKGFFKVKGVLINDDS